MGLLLLCLTGIGQSIIAPWQPVNNHYGWHFAAGFAIGGGLASLKNIPPGVGILAGTVGALMVGVAKEASDHNRGYAFDTNDAYFTMLGGAVSSVIVYYAKKKFPPKKKKKVFFFY